MLELAYELAATDDDRLLQAQELVRSYCGWHVAPSRTETLVVHPTPAGTILLPSLHVTSVTSVTVAGWPVLDPTYYQVFEHGEIRRVMGYRFTDRHAVTVEFTHGYDDAPADVAGVVQAIAQRASSVTPNLLQVGLVRYSDPGGSSFGILPEWRQVLDQYRLPRMP